MGAGQALPAFAVPANLKIYRCNSVGCTAGPYGQREKQAEKQLALLPSQESFCLLVDFSIIQGIAAKQQAAPMNFGQVVSSVLSSGWWDS